MSEVVVSARIRSARTTDLPAVEGLLAEAALPLEGLADQFDEGYAVAEAAGRLIAAGGVEVHGVYGLLRSVVVAADWRGRGVGEALVRERLEWARVRGLRRVYLLTTTAPSWFRRLGFATVSRDEVPASIRRAPEFASVCPSTAEAMEYTWLA